MRRQHQVIIASLNFDVVHRYGWKIVFQRGPVCSAIPRCPQTELGASKQEVSVPRMLAHHMEASG